MTKEEQKAADEKSFIDRMAEYKEEYINKNSIESMIYENGATTAILFKEVQHLSQLVKTLINGESNETNKDL